MTSQSSVTILMATHNGGEWIAEQVDSILNQQDVDVNLLVSDDMSTDNTYDYLTKLSKDDARVRLLPKHRFGSAAQNFLFLIANLPQDLSSDYYALSDQDDIWSSEKLTHAIHCIDKHNVDAYSSNVIAFWPTGKQKLIHKAQRQRDFDYMFESAGPGCTFVLKKSLVIALKKLLNKHKKLVPKVALHDWFIYAFARSSGYKWFIDPEPYMKYRQHLNNVVGANIGISAKLLRWKKLRQGWLLDQAVLIAEILDYVGVWPVQKMRHFDFFDKCILASNAFRFRRRLRDQFAFALSLFFIKKS